MKFDFLLAIIAENGEGGFETTKSISGLIVPMIVIASVLLITIILSFVIAAYSQKRKKSKEWVDFEALTQKFELSSEEANFVRRNLHKLGYTNPMDILKKEHEFDKFTKKILRRPNHHHEFLLQMVRKKAFTGHRQLKKLQESNANNTPVNQT